MMHVVVFSSVAALAVNMPSAMQRPSNTRCPSPVMIRYQPSDDDATRDLAPTLVNPNKRPSVKGMSYAEYMATRDSTTGNVVATSIQQAGQPSKAAAPAPAKMPRAPAAPAANRPILVQGGSLRTWAYSNPDLRQVQVELRNEGRPIDAEIELWQGPGNVPSMMRVYIEDGLLRPFGAVLATPPTGVAERPSFGDNVNAKPCAVPSTVAIRNVGPVEFPFAADVFVEAIDRPSAECVSSPSEKIQGGALRSYPFDPRVDSVQVLLTTDGRPLHARLEIMQGPNNNKQVIELYTEDGRTRPFFAIIETPSSGNVVRVINTGTMEYPLSATVVPDSINFHDAEGGDLGAFIGGQDSPRVGRYGR